MIFLKYKNAVITVFVVFSLISCNEEFEVNSSYFLPVNLENKTLVYKGEKAGDFKAVNKNIDWDAVENLIIEGHINHKDLYQIRNQARLNNSNVKSLDFKNADVLEGFFPDNLFSRNEQLMRFVYPRKIMRTGDFVYDKSFNLSELIIPEEVEILGGGVFYEVSFDLYNNKTPMAKNKYTIPLMVKELGISCFSNYPYKTLNIPDGVEKLGAGCFTDSKLEYLSIPPKVSIIPNSLFYNCKNLKNVKLHNNVKEIQDDAFSGSGIEELIMPTSINAVGKRFIKNTPNLKKIQWSPNISELTDEVLAGIDMEEFYLPSNITSLGRHCFKDAKTKRYYFHENVNSLGEGLFNFEISTTIFYMEELHVKWQSPPAVGKTFEATVDFGNIKNSPPNLAQIKLYVPKGTKAAYQNAKGWKNFGAIIEQ
ncbi:MAG: leucine-rich repeat domain-containing protein [Tenacibaculum sp.]